jgi:hypothetical protein
VSDADSNQTGAPFIRSIPNYIVVGNHDTGGNGDFVNMLGGDGISGRFNGATEGGDALAYYNNYYFPLNGPMGVDSMFVWNGDAWSPNGWFMSYSGKTYTSTAAINAYRSSTNVNTGGRAKNQIDHMSNFSFDSGNGHFLFLDANPHLFNAIVDSTANYSSPILGFPDYPTILKKWIINDLDASNLPWKIVVFHQPAFSSGNATLRNFQLRAVAKILEDHGVNIVFNGHEHNYQRTLPLRMLPGFADAPNPQLPPVVEIDSQFDGVAKSVPDGVLYVVEGTGGNRDFDGNEPNPRGQGSGQDQEDVATGTYSVAGLTFPNGPASWLDTNLTSAQMATFLPGAGTGPKITAKFKAKVFGFGDVVVSGNTLTLYQISEPLLSTSSASASNPFPFGADLNGKPLNDPIPDTLVDPSTGQVESPAAAPASFMAAVKPRCTGYGAGEGASGEAAALTNSVAMERPRRPVKARVSVVPSGSRSSRALAQAGCVFASGQRRKAVPSIVALAPRVNAAATPRPSPIPPAAMIGKAIWSARRGTNAKRPTPRRSAAAWSNEPRCPPAS